jgi:two-component system cell cycle response regulator
MAKKILVVDDVEDSRFILATTLQLYCHYHTIEAGTGKEAIEKAVAEKPDLIIMDLGLPDITGIEAAKALKENPSTAHIPIIAHTAWDFTKWEQAAHNAGMVAYLLKPVTKDLMKKTIEKFLG